MPDTATVIRWQRAGTTRYTLWHLPANIASDERERTQCGRYVERRRLETGSIADGALCRNCLRALQGSAPKAADDAAA